MDASNALWSLLLAKLTVPPLAAPSGFQPVFSDSGPQQGRALAWRQTASSAEPCVDLGALPVRPPETAAGGETVIELQDVRLARKARMAHALSVVQVRQSPPESKLRKMMCRVGRWMYARGLVVACEGNLSIRVGEDRILITPSGICKGRMSPNELLIVDMDGRLVSGTGKPSSETRVHLLYYRLRPDVQAVCHAHPPTATGFAAAGRALDLPVLPEVILGLGKIPLAAYGTPGTPEICEGLEPLMPTHDAILVANHGAVTCGEDLVEAYHRMEIVERFARILLTAETLGGARHLTSGEIRRLLATRRPVELAIPQLSAKYSIVAGTPRAFVHGRKRVSTATAESCSDDSA